MGQSVATELAQVRGMLVMSWRKEFEGHQKFAEAICWCLAMHAFRGKERNNDLVPPSMQADLFRFLGTAHADSPNVVRRRYFDQQIRVDTDFDDYWYGRKLRELALWKADVVRLGREGHLPREKVAGYLDSLKFLDLAHSALTGCRSELNNKTWARLVETKGSMLFTWVTSETKFKRQMLTQRQAHPWMDHHDYLDRRPGQGIYLPDYRMVPMKWWPERGALIWRIAVTEYPMGFDRDPPEGPKQWAVRLIMDPYYDVLDRMMQESRYQCLPQDWAKNTEMEELEEVRRRYSMFRRP